MSSAQSFLDAEAQWEAPEEVDEEKRMRNYITLLSATSWSETKHILSGIHDKFYLALAFNDMPELYRYKAVNLLNAWRAKAINEIILWWIARGPLYLRPGVETGFGGGDGAGGLQIDAVGG